MSSIEVHALVAFGDLLLPNGTRIKRWDIVRELIERRRWLSARASKALCPGANVVFYMNAVGVVAKAVIAGVSSIEAAERNSSRYGAIFGISLTLTEVTVFPKPLDVRPLLPRLGFVANKVYWGHSFRATPRVISRLDFETLVTGKAIAESTGSRSDHVLR